MTVFVIIQRPSMDEQHTNKLQTGKEDAQLTVKAGVPCEIPCSTPRVPRTRLASVSKSYLQKRFAGTSLLIPCKFPGRLRMASVYAGMVIEIFFAGIFCLQNSLPRESAPSESSDRESRKWPVILAPSVIPTSAAHPSRSLTQSCQ